MDGLDRIWGHPNDDDGLPFSSSVNEARVLDALTTLSKTHGITPEIAARTRQWMRFNQSLNVFETEPYVTWVATVYSRIHALLDQTMPENGKDDVVRPG